jgi:RimJ/RimL family protein N-acetyltransferase
MDKKTFEHTIYRNWAARFEKEIDAPLRAEDLRRPATHIMPKEAFSGTHAAHIWYVGQRAFVRVDPAYAEVLREVLDELRHGTLPSPRTGSEVEGEGIVLTGDILRATWGADRIKRRAWSLAHYLYPPQFTAYKAAPPFYVRQLTDQDAEGMAALKHACDPDDVETADVEVDHDVAFGCFADGAEGAPLVAAATGYRLTGFMDIGVLTHPAFRRRGLGKAAVSALCEWSIAREDIVVQYRCDVANVGSHSIARGLNFTLYFKHESLWL